MLTHWRRSTGIQWLNAVSWAQWTGRLVSLSDYPVVRPFCWLFKVIFQIRPTKSVEQIAFMLWDLFLVRQFPNCARPAVIDDYADQENPIDSAIVSGTCLVIFVLASEEPFIERRSKKFFWSSYSEMFWWKDRLSWNCFQRETRGVWEFQRKFL